MNPSTEHGQEVTNRTLDAPDGKSSLVSAQLPIEQVFATTRGEGEYSYPKNSGWQASIVNDSVLPDLDEALEQVILPAHGPVVVADLGCSSGWNTIEHVGHIIEKLRARLPDRASPPTEFQAFFSDLPSNDFNSLFQLLSGGSRDNLFVAGVPGSFYGRLFSHSSVHVFFSAFALHWISKIPDAAIDKNSRAFSKGKLWIDGPRVVTAEAFQEQASSDLKNFLNARAAELVPGGLLFIFFCGRCNPEPNNPWSDFTLKVGWQSVEEVWSDLISEGILTEEQLDTCNIPFFLRTVEEVVEAVESCGSDFHVQLSKFHIAGSHLGTPEPAEQCRRYGRMWRGFLTVLFETHMGKEAAKIFWQRFDQVLEKNLVPKFKLQPKTQDGFLTIALVRK